ncbi:DUF551 domain-containing protein [Klebsiella aerogenes]|uniref:DUF551 domain-containing protein n=1 Tax=Klebsiella aerogenes TaxID=548 RepID=UPI0028A553A2|nr:DUF551 domain-containing protein [Klebsiella aerogenes]MDT4309823.1 DUF551 domain-containing protein [Klebsiella aerogenes]
MTKSTITREQLTEELKRRILVTERYPDLETAQIDAIICKMALAAMDSEPVAWLLSGGGAENVVRFDSGNAYADPLREVTPLYRHAQSAPEYPETLPCPVFLEPGMRFGKGVKTRLVLEAIKRRAEHYAELEAMTPEERAEYDAGIEAFKAMLPKPVNVSPDFDTWFNGHDAGLRVVNYHIQRELQESAWNACRSAMLRAGALANEDTKQSWTGIPDIDNAIIMLDRIDTQESCDDDRIEAVKAVLRGLAGNSPVIPDTWIPVSERLPEEGGRYWCYVEEQNDLGKSHYQWNCSWNGERWWVESENGGIVTHWMPLLAAPQEVNHD